MADQFPMLSLTPDVPDPVAPSAAPAQSIQQQPAAPASTTAEPLAVPVDLVSAHALSGKSGECSGNFSKSSRYLCSCFFLLQLRRSRKQSHALHASTAFHLIWIADCLTQHLISATDPKNNGILRFLFDQRLQTIFPHPFQIGHCIFTARKHDHVRVV